MEQKDFGRIGLEAEWYRDDRDHIIKLGKPHIGFVYASDYPELQDKERMHRFRQDSFLYEKWKEKYAINVDKKTD